GVEAALVLADLLGDIADFGEAVGIELRPIVQRANHIRSGARLNGGRGARLDVVTVDHLDIERDAEVLRRGRHDLLAQKLVRGGNEVVPPQPVPGRSLRIGGRPAASQDRRNPSGFRRKRAGARKLEQLAPMNSSHVESSLSLIVDFLSSISSTFYWS